MNYIDINFTEIKGYNNLSNGSKKLFEQMYKSHNAGQGLEYKEDWIPVCVKQHKNYFEVHFKNGEWLHFYSNGTWG